MPEPDAAEFDAMLAMLLRIEHPHEVTEAPPGRHWWRLIRVVGCMEDQVWYFDAGGMLVRVDPEDSRLSR